MIRIEYDMLNKREIPLKIELFHNGEDNQYSIRSKREIQSILRNIANDKRRVALYYDDDNNFILTSVLQVNEYGLWLDVGSIVEDNERILLSNKIVFISSHRQVKIQFIAKHIASEVLDGSVSFYLPLPETLLRIQRREYFRLTTPVVNPLKCIIPLSARTANVPVPVSKREVTIMDISGGGMALVCEAQDSDLQPGCAYENCRIPLPGIGTITATIKVRNAFVITPHDGHTSKRVGCEFTHLSVEAASLLQRYVVNLQSGSLVKT